MDVLIERESELAVLGEVVAAAARGRGGAVLIEGEAGIGKTRLLELARARAAAAGARVLYATADEIEASVPLAGARVLLGRAARGVAPDGPARLGVLALDGALPDPSGPGSRGDEVVHALWWLIVELADEQPLALFLDDAQWADELTLRSAADGRAARARAAARARRRRPAGGAGSAHVVLAAERAFVRLEPAPLSVAGTARLLEAVLGRPGSVAAGRAGARGDPRQPAVSLGAAAAGGGRGADALSEAFVDGRPPPQLVRLVGDRLERLSPRGDRARARRRGAGSRRRGRPGARARRARRDGGHRRRGRSCAASACSTRARTASPTRWSRRRRARGSARRTPASCTRARPRCSPATAWTISASPSTWCARRRAATPASWRRCAVPPRRRGASAPWRPRRGCSSARWPSRLAADLVDAVDFERGRALLDAGAEDGVRVLARVAQRAADVSLRVDAARHLARRLGLERPRRRRCRRSCAAFWRRCPTPTGELRLELLVELAFIGNADLATHAQATRMIAAEAARATGRTPGERLVLVAAHVIARREARPTRRAPRGRCSALRLHRDYPGGFAVGSLTFGAIAMLINADALDDAERAMDVAARGRRGDGAARPDRRRALAAGADRLPARRPAPAASSRAAARSRPAATSPAGWRRRGW